MIYDHKNNSVNNNIINQFDRKHLYRSTIQCVRYICRCSKYYLANTRHICKQNSVEDIEYVPTSHNSDHVERQTSRTLGAEQSYHVSLAAGWLSGSM